MEATGITSLVGMVLKELGPTPILIFLIILLIAPWVALIWFMRSVDKRTTKVFERQDKRFEEVVNMYNRNVDLVKAYEKVSDDLQDLVILVTQTMQTLVEHIKNNFFCPLNRPKK